MRRRGVTLVELLVVLTIIAVVVGLLLPAIGLVRRVAREADTAQRMEAVTRGLQQGGRAAAGRVEALQREAGLGGPLRFGSAEMAETLAASTGGAAPPGYTLPYDGAAFAARTWAALRRQISEVLPPTGVVAPAGWHQATWPSHWPTTDWQALGARPPILRAPWGRPALRLDGSPVDPALPPDAEVGRIDERVRSVSNTYGNLGGVAGGAVVPVPNAWVTHGGGDGYADYVASATQTAPVADVVARRSDGSSAPAAANAPVPFDLGWCSPLASARLLQAAGILPPGTEGLRAYREDRTPTRPWNDSSGQPLVVVYALFVPERYVRAWDGHNRRSLLLHRAREVYGYERALYVAVASAGARLPPGLAATWEAADEPAVLRDHWTHVRAVCRAHEWTEAAWADPPWTGARAESETVAGHKVRCQLSAPVEIQ